MSYSSRSQALFNKIMIVQLMLNKWVLNAVVVGTPVALHGAAQLGVHIKVSSCSIN